MVARVDMLSCARDADTALIEDQYRQLIEANRLLELERSHSRELALAHVAEKLRADALETRCQILQQTIAALESGRR